jgi:hypothetical protein
LKFTYEGNPQSPDELRPLKISNLEELGIRLKQEHARFRDKSDLFVGMMNAVVDDGKIVEVLSNQYRRFKNKYLIGLAEEYTSLMGWDTQDHLTRKILLQKSDFVFSSNSETRGFCLGEKHSSEEEFIKEFKSLKPCFWGSDAHTYEVMFEPDQKRYTWIKADPSFEGLRQTIFEPKDRVYIGEDCPVKADKGRIIKSLVLENTRGWFEDKEYCFNEGLISIIGGKGAGKTALLDLIAYASDECVKEIFGNDNSFLKKALSEIKGSKVKIRWGDDEIMQRDINFCRDRGLGSCHNVVYLSQSFVANLCSEAGKEQLQSQIENVIFQNIPEEDKANFNTFSEYQLFKLRPISLQKEKITQRLIKTNNALKNAWSLIKQKDQSDKELKSKTDLLKKRESELKSIAETIKDEAFKKKIDELSKLRESQRKAETEIASLQEKSSLIFRMQSDIEEFRGYSKSFFESLKNNLKSLDVTDSIIDAANISLNLDVDSVLSQKQKEILDALKTKSNELKELKGKIKQLDESLLIDQAKKNKLLELEGLIKVTKKEIDNLQELAKAIQVAEQNIPLLTGQQLSISKDHFKNLFEEKDILQELYASLQSTLLSRNEENERLFEFFIEFDFNAESFAYQGDSLVDHRKEGTFHNTKPDEFLEKINEMGFSLDLSQDLQILNGKKELDSVNNERIERFIAQVKGLFGSTEREIESRITADLEKFYDWLFSFEYYKVGYTIKFNGKKIENLSPGLKGVALLILFLELDKEDTRPILIDQPEENLDNRSVYRTLKNYFREAKKRRQIFIVTHNPNLVVNTDSEQIYVANFDKDKQVQPSVIAYVSGGIEDSFKKEEQLIPDLENMGIRQHILDILEGSEKAFKLREQKYSIDESYI